MDPKPEKQKVSQLQFIDSMRKGTDQNFSNCEFTESLRFTSHLQGAINHNFSFDNCSFRSIEFQGMVFLGKFKFQSCQIAEMISITTCEFRGHFHAYNISTPRIAIWNNNFFNGFDLYDFDKVNDLTLQFGKVKGRIHVKQWHVNPAELTNIHIMFEHIEGSQIHFEDFVSQKIEIQFPGKHLTESVRITGIKSNELKIINLKNKSNNQINLERISVGQLVFLWLHNDGWLSIQNIDCNARAKSLFSLQDCYLGRAELYHIDLASFENIKIYNCHLQDIVPVSVKWNFDTNAYKETKTSYLRELFRQLKNVCSKNMDKISQLRFEKMEMYYYSAQLNWRTNTEDWIIFKTNQFSNNHGQSWIRPLLWLFGVSFILYTILLYFYGNFGCYHIGNYLYFVMPFHSVDDVLCLKSSAAISNNWVQFWDILQKLFSGYFIFQFLRAFRRFVT